MKTVEGKVADEIYSNYLNDADKLYKDGKTTEALKTYDKAIELYPKIPAAYAEKGDIMMKSGRQQEAIEEFTKAIKNNPNYKDAKLLNAESHYKIALIHNELGQHDKAGQNLKEAVKIKPEYKNILYETASNLQNEGKYQDAIKIYDTLIAHDPNTPAAYAEKGNIMHEQGNYKEAEKLASIAIEKNPNYANAYALRGGAILKQKDENRLEAISDLGKATELNPNHAIAYVNKAKAYDKLKGQESLAQESMDKARELVSSNQLKHYTGKDLNHVKDSIKEFDKAREPSIFAKIGQAIVNAVKAVVDAVKNVFGNNKSIVDKEVWDNIGKKENQAEKSNYDKVKDLNVNKAQILNKDKEKINQGGKPTDLLTKSEIEVSLQKEAKNIGEKGNLQKQNNRETQTSTLPDKKNPGMNR